MEEIGMNSWGAAQWIIAGYLTVVAIGAPALRSLMIKSGAKGFVPWGEFWAKWGSDVTTKVALVAVLFWGGFWS